MCTSYGSFRVKAKGVTYERVHTDIGLYMRVHIIQRYDDTMKEKGVQERERKETDIYIQNLQVAPSCLQCCFFETTRAAFMCSCILYMHISAYAHTHIQAHSLMRALTLLCARTHARTRMPMHATHTGARAQTRMHPGTRRPDYARTHVPAHEHACMRTHTRKHTRTCTHAHAHPRYAHARSHMQACARTVYMHAYARGTCTHAPAQCSCMCTHAHARTRLHMRPHSCEHTPTYFGCALTDWGHTPQQ